MRYATQPSSGNRKMTYTNTQGCRMMLDMWHSYMIMISTCIYLIK